MDAARYVDRLTRYFATRTSRRTALGSALAGLTFSRIDRLGAAQDATPPPHPTPAQGEKPVFMFVQTFASGRGEVNPGTGTPAVEGSPASARGASFLLTLDGHSGQTIYFSDRPDRIVGAIPTVDFLSTIGFGVENPPNAALVAEFQVGQGVVVLQLIDPVYDEPAGTLTYGVEVLDAYEGGNLEPVTREKLAERLPAEFGSAALFIDDCRDIKLCINDYTGTSCGAIPGGPYGQCWQGLFKGGCAPCWEWETWEYLNGLCHDAYGPNCSAF